MDGGRNVPLHRKVLQVLRNSLWSSTSADKQQQKESVNKALTLLLFKSTPNDVTVNDESSLALSILHDLQSEDIPSLHNRAVNKR